MENILLETISLLDYKDEFNLRCLSKDIDKIIMNNIYKHLKNIQIKIKRELSEKDFITFILMFKPKNINLNWNKNITNKAFEHLKGIHILHMNSYNQGTITDKAFENLKGIYTLNMNNCEYETITDEALYFLK